MADQELLAAARGGDRDAFARLIAPRFGRIDALARSVTGDARAAEDAVRQALSEAWRDLPGRRDPEAFDPWIDRLVVRASRSRAGRRSRYQVREIQVREIPVVPYPRPDPAATTHSTDLSAELPRMLADVTARPQHASWRLRLAAVSTALRDAGAAILKPRPLAFVVVAGSVLAVVLQATLLPPPPKPPPIPANGLLAFSREGDILVWDPQSDRTAALVRGTGLLLTTPIWSPDGRRLAFSDQQANWHVLDVATLATRPIGTYDRVVWSPDSSTLAGATYERIDLIDAATGERHVLVPSDPNGGPSLGTWSPDGRWLAAVHGQELLLIDPRSGRATRLLMAVGESRGFDQPSFSPDSKRLAYLEVDCSGERRCTHAVAVVSLDGSDRRVLTEYQGAYLASPTWSPDGTWIGYALGGSLSIVHPDGTDAREIGISDGGWAWSPDGGSLVYKRAGGPQESGPLEVADLETGSVAVLGLAADALSWQPLDPGRTAALPAIVAGPQPSATPDPVIAEAPSAPPADPSRSAAGLGVEAGCSVLVYDFASASAHAIASEPNCPAVNAAGAQWAADGSAIVVTADGRRTVIGRDGTILQDVEGVSDTSWASWSSRGHYLVEADDGAPPTYAIVRPDGSGRVSIPGSPSWSADDARVAVATPGGQLFVGDGDGSNLRPIGEFPAPASWSPRSDAFAFIRDGQLWIVGADGRDARQVTDFPLGGAASAFWSPDGRRLAVTRGDQVWLVAPDGTQQWVLSLPASSYWGASWSPDGSRLALTGQAVRGYQNGVLTVTIVSVDGGSAVSVPNLEQMSWSPDGRFLAGFDYSATVACQTVAVLNANGSGRTPIWSGDCGFGTYAWLP